MDKEARDDARSLHFVEAAEEHDDDEEEAEDEAEERSPDKVDDRAIGRIRIYVWWEIVIVVNLEIIS